MPTIDAMFEFVPQSPRESTMGGRTYAGVLVRDWVDPEKGAPTVIWLPLDDPGPAGPHYLLSGRFTVEQGWDLLGRLDEHGAHPDLASRLRQVLTAASGPPAR